MTSIEFMKRLREAGLKMPERCVRVSIVAEARGVPRVVFHVAADDAELSAVANLAGSEGMPAALVSDATGTPVPAYAVEERFGEYSLRVESPTPGGLDSLVRKHSQTQLPAVWVVREDAGPPKRFVVEQAGLVKTGDVSHEVRVGGKDFPVAASRTHLTAASAEGHASVLNRISSPAWRREEKKVEPSGVPGMWDVSDKDGGFTVPPELVPAAMKLMSMADAPPPLAAGSGVGETVWVARPVTGNDRFACAMGRVVEADDQSVVVEYSTGARERVSRARCFHTYDGARAAAELFDDKGWPP